MANPNIQIDDVVREMTDEEYAKYTTEISEPAKTPTPKK